MTGPVEFLSSHLLGYLRAISVRETTIQKELRSVTDKLPESGWEVSPEQAQFLALIVEIIGAKRILELGTFTGHSSLAMGAALPKDGLLITCDMEPSYTSIASEFWFRAGIKNKIKLIHGPAIKTLQKLLKDVGDNYFDLVFIDANKKDYDRYYELSLRLLRPRGVMAIDNIFWNGAVLDPHNTEKSTVAIRNLNEKLYNDERISLSTLPINDGLTLIWKRP